MSVTLEIPEGIAGRLRAAWSDVPRRALEAVAVEAYRSGALTSGEVQELLGLSSRWETDAFLKRSGAFLAYDEAELERDRSVLDRYLT